MTESRECGFVVERAVWDECMERAEVASVEASDPNQGLEQMPEVENHMAEAMWADHVVQNFAVYAMMALATEVKNYEGAIKVTLTIEDYDGERQETK